MISNFVKVILRYLLRSRFFTFLNVTGLSTGMACCIVIFLFIKNELSYDNFHENRGQIYRVIRQSQINGLSYDIGVTSGPFAPALLEEYQGKIQDAVRVASFNSLLMRYDEKSFLEDKIVLADPNFFRFFTFPLLRGDARTALDNPNSLVISKAFAKKYFGEEDPIGKTVSVDNEYDLTVTGILDDLPGNTHMQFQAVSSLRLIEHEPYFAEWWNNFLGTYVRVDNPLDATYLNGYFPQFMDKHFGKDFARVGNKIGLKLEPLTDIYFNYETRYETNVIHGNKLYVYVFGSLGILLIVLASINYINLATAQAAQRAKEVGIRKTLGSSQRGIAAQFLSESFVLCLIAMCAAVILSQLAIPFFNDAFDTSIPYIDGSVSIWLFFGGMLLIISLMSGGYPAFMLASFRPIRVLRGEIKGNFQYLIVRKALVVFQFAISALMITATFFIGEQLRYMNEKDLGFSPDHVVKIRINNPVVGQNSKSLRDRVISEKFAISASYISGHPGGFYDASTVRVQGSEENIRMRTLYSDENLLSTLDLKMAAGRFFSSGTPGDSSSAVVLNETAVRQLGWTPDEALGRRVSLSQFDSTYKEVVGVISDYHFTSLKEVIEPLIISYRDDSRNLLVKIAGTSTREAVATIEQVWNSYESGFPIEMTFLDDVIGQLYYQEASQGRMFRIFSGISVVIACIGILGLSTYLAVQRKKEIGIRKVLGASVSQLSFLLARDLVQLVLLANVLMIPIAYLILEQWAQTFAYRAPFDPFLFLWAALAVTAVAFMIVTLNAARAAHEDPVSSLRPE